MMQSVSDIHRMSETLHVAEAETAKDSRNLVFVRDFDSNVVEVFHNFGIFDKKGREIGARITTYIVTRKIWDDGIYGSAELKTIGDHIAYRAQLTRGGKKFGAIQHEKWCESYDEREKMIACYLENSKNRALKKYKNCEVAK